jgi:hypothetical protein
MDVVTAWPLWPFLLIVALAFLPVMAWLAPRRLPWMIAALLIIAVVTTLVWTATL